MSTKTIQSTSQYQVVYHKTFGKQSCLLKISADALQFIGGPETILVPMKEVNLSPINPADQLLSINKKTTITCQTGQFNMRAAIIADIAFAQLKYKVPVATSWYTFKDLINDGQAMEFAVINQQIPVIRPAGSEQIYQIRPESLQQQLFATRTDIQNELGMSLLTEDLLQKWSFQTSKDLDKVIEELQQFAKKTGLPKFKTATFPVLQKSLIPKTETFSVLEHYHYAYEKLTEKDVFAKISVMNRKSQRKIQFQSNKICLFTQNGEFAREIDLGLLWNVVVSDQVIIQQDQGKEKEALVLNVDALKSRLESQKSVKMETKLEAQKLGNAEAEKETQNSVHQSDKETENQELQLQAEGDAPTFGDESEKQGLQKSPTAAGILEQVEVQERALEAAISGDQGADELNSDNNVQASSPFFVILETCSLSPIILNFQNQDQLYKFVAEIAQKLAAKSLPVTIRYYVTNPLLRIGSYLQPMSSLLIEKAATSLKSKSPTYLQQLAVFVDGYPRTLPIVLKDKELLQTALQVFDKSEVMCEKLLILDFLRLCISSRTLFRSIIEDYGVQLINSLAKSLKDDKAVQFSNLRASAIILLRAVLSFQWKPTSGAVGASYAGGSRAFSVGLSENVLSEKERQQLQKMNKESDMETVTTITTLQNLELEAFANKGVGDKSSGAASIGIHSEFQQGKNYHSTRLEAEKLNREQIFAKIPICLPLIGALVSNFQAVKSRVTQVAIVGILEDLIVTKSHLSSKWFTEQLTVYLKNGAKGDIPQPAGRKEMMLLIYEGQKAFVELARQSESCIRQSICLILKQCLFEQILSLNIRKEICYTFVQSGAILTHLVAIINVDSSLVTKVISTQLMAAAYSVSTPVQQTLNKVFPHAFIDTIKPCLSIAKLDAASYSNCCQPFNDNLTCFKLLLDLITKKQYDLNIVWDQSMCKSVTYQLVDILDDFDRVKIDQKNACSWNYQQFELSLRGSSEQVFCQFDIDVNNVVLSSILRLGDDGLNKQVGLDNSLFYEEMLRCNKEGKLQVSEFTSKINVVLQSKQIDVSKLLADLYQKCLQSQEDTIAKCGCLFAIQTISMANQIKFQNILSLATEATRSIKENDLLSLLYQLSLLECCCYQVNPEDQMKRPYFASLLNHDLIYYICAKILPLPLYENCLIDLNEQIPSNFNLIQQQVYGNVIAISLRILTKCVQYCPSYDHIGNKVYPVPQIYDILLSRSILPILVGLVLIGQRSKNQYSTIDLDNLSVPTTQTLSMSLTTALNIYGAQQDFYKSIFGLCCNLVKELADQDDSSIQFFIQSGIIEMSVNNQLDAESNIQVVEMLKSLLKNQEAEQLLQRFLPLPFIGYVKYGKSSDVATAFCSNAFIQINCVWTKSMREQLKDTLQTIADLVFQAFKSIVKVNVEKQFLTDVKKFVNQHKSFLPIMWFEALEEHPLIDAYEDISDFEKYRVGTVYTSLLDYSVYKKFYEHMTTLTIDEEGLVTVIKNGSETKVLLDEITANRYQQMKKDVEKELNLSTCLNMLQDLLQFDRSHQYKLQAVTQVRSATTEDLQEEEAKNDLILSTDLREKFESEYKSQLIDVSYPFQYKFVHFIVEIIKAKVPQFQQKLQSQHKEESELLKKMEAFAKKTGGSGLAVLNQVEHARHPDLLRGERKQGVRIASLIVVIIGLVFKQVIQSLKLSQKSIESLDFDNFDDLVHLAIQLFTTDFGAFLSKLAEQSADLKGDHFHQIGVQIAEKIKTAKELLIRELVQMLNFMIAELSQQQPETMNKKLIDTFFNLILKIEPLISPELVSVVDPAINDGFITILTKFYQEQIDNELQKKAVQSTIKLMQILAKLKSTAFSKKTFAFMMLGAFYGDLEMISVLVMAIGYYDKQRPEMKACQHVLNIYVYSSFSADQLMQRVREPVHSDTLIMTKSSFEYLKQHVTEICFNSSEFSFDELLSSDVDKILDQELKLNQYYLGAITSLIVKNSLSSGKFDPKSLKLAIPNFGQQTQSSSNNREIFVTVLKFVKLLFRQCNFAMSGPQVDFVEDSHSYFNSNFDERFETVLLSSVGVLCYMAACNGDLSKLIAEDEELLSMFFAISAQVVTGSLKELVCEVISGLLLVLVYREPDLVIKHVVNYYRHYGLLILKTRQTCDQGAQFYLQHPLQMAQSTFDQSEYENLNVEQLFKFTDETIFHRIAVLQQIIVKSVAKQPTAFLDRYLDLFQLSIFIKNVRVLKAEPTALEKFLCVTSVECLSTLLPISIFLQQMLPFPLQLAIVHKNRDKFSQFLSCEFNLPELYWNQQCTAELCEFVQKLTDEQLVPYFEKPDRKLNLNLNYIEQIPFLKLAFHDRDLYVGGVFLSIYNAAAQSQNVLVSQPEVFISALLVTLQNKLAEKKLLTIQIYLKSLLNFLKMQTKCCLLAFNNPIFPQIIQLLLFDQDFACGLVEDQVLAQDIFDSTVDILHQITGVPVDLTQLFNQKFVVDLVYFFCYLYDCEDEENYQLQNVAFAQVGATMEALMPAEKKVAQQEKLAQALASIVLSSTHTRIQLAKLPCGQINKQPSPVDVQAYDVFKMMLFRASFSKPTKNAISAIFCAHLEQSSDYRIDFSAEEAADKYHKFIKVMTEELDLVFPAGSIDGAAKTSQTEEIPIPICKLEQFITPKQVVQKEQLKAEKFSQEDFDFYIGCYQSKSDKLARCHQGVLLRQQTEGSKRCLLDEWPCEFHVARSTIVCLQVGLYQMATGPKNQQYVTELGFGEENV